MEGIYGSHPGGVLPQSRAQHCPLGSEPGPGISTSNDSFPSHMSTAQQKYSLLLLLHLCLQRKLSLFTKMKLLDLPLELIREILKTAVAGNGPTDANTYCMICSKYD